MKSNLNNMRRIIVISENEDSNALYERILSKEYVNHYLRTIDNLYDTVKFLKQNTIHYIIVHRVANLPAYLDKIMKNKPEAHLIFVARNEDRDNISLAMRYKAQGIIEESRLEKDLNNAINLIANGESFYSQEIASLALNEIIKKDNDKISGPGRLPSLKDLTKREIQILELILDELTNYEIAERIFVSPRTVDTHRRNLLQKVRARNTVGLIKFAFRNGLID